MNASDPKQVRKAAKDAKVRDRLRQDVIHNLMSTIAGRAFVYDLLSGCHVFASSFALNGLQMAFNEGERNTGLKVLGDVMQAAPESYPLMMREANERSIGQQSGSQATNGGASGKHPGTEDNDRGGASGDPDSGAESGRDPDAPDPFGYYKG